MVKNLLLIGLVGVGFIACSEKEPEMVETSTPAPEVVRLPPLPSPNGYEALLQACDHTRNPSEPLDTLSRAALEAYVASHKMALQLIRTALETDSRVSLGGEREFSSGHDDDLEGLNRLAGLLVAQAKFFEQVVQIRRSVETYLDVIRVGIRTANGGMHADWLAGAAIEERGIAGMRSLLPRLSRDNIKLALDGLAAIEAERPSPNDMLAWDDLLSRSLHRPHFESLSADEQQQFLDDRASVAAEWAKQLGSLRELRIRLASRLYLQTRGKKPESLELLVPEILAEVPINPQTEAPYDISVLP